MRGSRRWGRKRLVLGDPDSDNGKEGSGDRRGSAADRNVELLLENPYGTLGGGDNDEGDDDEGDDD